LQRDGHVTCCYEALQLAAGDYLIDVAIHASDGTAYDYWCGAASVTVTTPVAWPGVWAPPHRWQGEGPEWQPPRSGDD
jgi:hypothetical protein